MISFEPLFEKLEKQNLSLYDLVKNGACAYACYKNIESGGVVRIGSLKRIGEFLNCDIEEICKWTGDE